MNDFIQTITTTMNSLPGQGSYIYTAVIAFAIILMSQILAWGARKVIKRVRRLSDITKHKWDSIVVESVENPLCFVIKVAGFLIALVVISQEIENELFDKVIKNSSVIFIPVFAWFFFNLIKNYETRRIKEISESDAPGDVTTAQAISKLIRLSIVIITILLILQNLGVNLTGVLAAGGIGGIAIGFAAQDLLANLFGGLMLYLEKPFKVGDWVRSPDRDIEGTVTEIGFRTTMIKTFDQRPIYVPNSIFTSIVLENPSRMTNRRIYETIGVRYQDISSIESILKEIRLLLQESPDIDTRLTTMVNFNQFSASSIDFFVYCFTKTKNWQEYHLVKEKVLLEVSEIIAKNGAEIAFPTTTIHIDQSPKDAMEMQNFTDPTPTPFSK